MHRPGWAEVDFPVLVIQNVSKVYEMGDCQVHALKHTSLAVRAGEMIAIMGPSGSGKSTLLQIMGCLDRPTTGKVLIDGEDVSLLSDVELARTRNSKLGFIFQAFNLMPHETALHNVEVPLQYAGLGRRERRRLAEEALRAVGLGERLFHRPAELSGGQRQRVAIARAVVNKPLVILADEPTGALDVKSGIEVMGILQRLNQEGRTIVIVTHDPGIAEYASRIVRISDGRITSEELVESPKVAGERKVMVPAAGIMPGGVSMRAARRGEEFAHTPAQATYGYSVCGVCGLSNRPQAIFCRNCGTQMEFARSESYRMKPEATPQAARSIHSCSECGASNRPKARYCAYCGKYMT